MYKPVVELMPGWLTDISKYRTYDELPDNARNYIEKLEKLLGVSLDDADITFQLQTAVKIDKFLSET